MKENSKKEIVLKVILVIAIVVIIVLSSKIFHLMKLNEKMVCGTNIENEYNIDQVKVDAYKDMKKDFYKKYSEEIGKLKYDANDEFAYNETLVKIKPQDSMTNIASIEINKNKEAVLNFEYKSKLYEAYPDGYLVKNVINAFYTPVGNGDYVEVDLIKDDGTVLTVDAKKDYEENKIEFLEVNPELNNVILVQRVGMDKYYVTLDGKWIKTEK